MNQFIHINSSPDNLKPYSFSLVMPVYYEGPRVIPVIMTLIYTAKYPFELILVYDKSDDPTIVEAKRLCEKYSNIKLICNDNPPGVISAIKTGIKHSSSENIAVWCAYHVDPYGMLNKMYELILAGCDVVSANRFMKVKRYNRGGLVKKILSRTGNFILWKLVGSPFGDTTTSIKMYRKSFLKDNPIETARAGGWALSLELSIKASIGGYKLGEIILIPSNINLIQGLSNFKVFKFLPYYFKWVLFGLRNRKKIAKNKLFKRIEVTD